MTAMFWRSRFKYGARAYRFALMEAGHVGQNLLLAAAALGLGAVPLGGFYDREVDAFLGVDGIYEASLYLVPVGYPAT
jgi:SagB-type dehydrogenase family enzyme